MVELWLSWLESSALSQSLNASIWVYPLINAGHILGLALLIGAIVPLDLRILGLWPHTDARSLGTVLKPVAVAGLSIALLCGLLLFSTQPADYAASKLFLLKILLLILAITNALSTRLGNAWQQWSDGAPASNTLKAHAVSSLLLWPLVALLGRLVGYR